MSVVVILPLTKYAGVLVVATNAVAHVKILLVALVVSMFLQAVFQHTALIGILMLVAGNLRWYAWYWYFALL